MFLYKQKFKYMYMYDDLHVALLMLTKGDYMISFEVKSGYHHMDIAQVYHKCMGRGKNTMCSSCFHVGYVLIAIAY